MPTRSEPVPLTRTRPRPVSPSTAASRGWILSLLLGRAWRRSRTRYSTISYSCKPENLALEKQIPYNIIIIADNDNRTCMQLNVITQWHYYSYTYIATGIRPCIVRYYHIMLKGVETARIILCEYQNMQDLTKYEY